MSRNLSDLKPEFRIKVEAALAALAGEGLTFRPYFTLRDPVTQARLWRQSRSATVVQQKIQSLRDMNCDFIVDCFEKAGATDGPWATNALPGQSWHQYGEAVDCFLVDASGRPTWESPKYSRFGQVGDAHGMWWGGHFGDNDHWQDRRSEPPDVFGSLKQINDDLERTWGTATEPAAVPRVSPAPAYRPSQSVLSLMGRFANQIPTTNPNTQPFVHPPRFLGSVQSAVGRVLVIDSALELDTDGWIGGRGDADWQSGTSLQYTGGTTSLNANRVPYFVLPLPTTWPAAFGISLGDYAAVLFNGKLSFAVFGDFGPPNKIGEGSIELLRSLGQDRLRPDGTIINAGTNPGVLTVVFPGSGTSGDRSDEPTLLASITRRGTDLFNRLKA